MKRCMIRAEYLMKIGISEDFLSAITDYISCYEQMNFSCKEEMLGDFVRVMKAYRKHLEENQGEYGKMVNKIELHPTE